MFGSSPLAPELSKCFKSGDVAFSPTNTSYAPGQIQVALMSPLNVRPFGPGSSIKHTPSPPTPPLLKSSGHYIQAGGPHEQLHHGQRERIVCIV